VARNPGRRFRLLLLIREKEGGGRGSPARSRPTMKPCAVCRRARLLRPRGFQVSRPIRRGRGGGKGGEKGKGKGHRICSKLVNIHPNAARRDWPRAEIQLHFEIQKKGKKREKGRKEKINMPTTSGRSFACCRRRFSDYLGGSSLISRVTLIQGKREGGKKRNRRSNQASRTPLAASV